MPLRAIGSAVVSFGLVSVPVNLYSSSDTRSSISFNMLHKACGSRLKQQYVCQHDGEVVGREDTVKGYEYSKDQYVVFTPEELKALEEKANGAIEIVEFVPMAKVDREYLEKVYYLAPDKGGERAYALLCAALHQTEFGALGQYAARGQQYLVLLRENGGRLCMDQLRYADEVRLPTEVAVPNCELKPAELALAKQLVSQLAKDAFEPTKYRDTVRERVLEAIQRKVNGEAITSEPAAASTPVVDLLTALQASLAKAS